MKNGHTPCAALLIEFQHKWDLLRVSGWVEKTHLVQAAETGCVGLFKDLLESEVSGEPQAHGHDLHNAVRIALENGHIAFIRYLIETKAMTTTSILAKPNAVTALPLGIAAMSGSRPMIDTLLPFGPSGPAGTLLYSFAIRP